MIVLELSCWAGLEKKVYFFEGLRNIFSSHSKYYAKLASLLYQPKKNELAKVKKGVILQFVPKKSNFPFILFHNYSKKVSFLNEVTKHSLLLLYSYSLVTHWICWFGIAKFVDVIDSESVFFSTFLILSLLVLSRMTYESRIFHRNRFCQLFPCHWILQKRKLR